MGCNAELENRLTWVVGWSFTQLGRRSLKSTQPNLGQEISSLFSYRALELVSESDETIPFSQNVEKVLGKVGEGVLSKYPN